MVLVEAVVDPAVDLEAPGSVVVDSGVVSTIGDDPGAAGTVVDVVDPAVVAPVVVVGSLFAEGPVPEEGPVLEVGPVVVVVDPAAGTVVVVAPVGEVPDTGKDPDTVVPAGGATCAGTAPTAGDTAAWVGALAVGSWWVGTGTPARCTLPKPARSDHQMELTWTTVPVWGALIISPPPM